MTIHIIDDEPLSADMLGDFLRLMGHEIHTYTLATLFFEKNTACTDGDILILDLIMPDMDGVEVMRRLAEKNISVPLILISGYDSGVLHSAEQLAKAHSLNILATLTKPLQLNILGDIVRTYTHNIQEKPTHTDPDKPLVTKYELEYAIENAQLVLHYQPQIDLASNSFTGVEALVRWQHPEYGLIYPDAFVPLAEKCGLIGDLTAQVIRQAVDQMLVWKEQHVTMQISINISAENITSLTLPEQLSSMLDESKLDPSMLILEVTESAMMGDPATSLDILTRLRMKGIEISIDDFGTGYSSLSQLYKAPFTELKIDRSFVTHIEHDDDARGIVKTCIALGHQLHMRVVAEGIEDINTFNILRNMGCDIAQGYHISKPKPAEDLRAWKDNYEQEQTQHLLRKGA